MRIYIYIYKHICFQVKLWNGWSAEHTQEQERGGDRKKNEPRLQILSAKTKTETETKTLLRRFLVLFVCVKTKTKAKAKAKTDEYQY